MFFRFGVPELKVPNLDAELEKLEISPLGEYRTDEEKTEPQS